MASFTLTVADDKLERLKAAYGASTNAQLKQAIVADIKAKVVAYEVNEAIEAGRVSLATAQDNYSTSVRNAQTTAENEIVVT